MATPQVTVRGTVKPDGTLELEAPVPLSSGPVQVTIQPVLVPESGSPSRSLIDVLDEIRAAQRPRGDTGRTIEQMEAEEARQRAEDEEDERRWQTIWGQTGGEPPLAARPDAH